MSHGYGFLTQSTIIPKKSKQIKMNDNSGQLLLESILQKQKEKLKSHAKNQKQLPNHNQKKRNPGIQQRIKRDEQQDQKLKLTQKNYYKCLEKKAEVYEKAANKKLNIEKLLVDFQVKENQNKEEEQEYQKARQSFYKGQIRNIEDQQKSLHENVEAENLTTNMMRQRLAWEKQMLNQMNGVQSEEQKPKVIQSFDHKMSKEQKEAFEKIMNEEQQQKIKLQSIRRRKQLMEQERIRKLRKLNIIKDVSEAIKQQQMEKGESEGQDNK